MARVTSGVVTGSDCHALRIRGSLRRVLALVGRPDGGGLPVLPVLRRRGPVPAGLPINAAIATMEAMEASAGRVGRRPSCRRVQVALVAGLVAVRPLDAAAKVATSITCHGERTEQACTVRVLYAAVGACKGVSVLAFSISYRGSEVGVTENGRPKMAMGRPAGSPAESLKMAGRRPLPSQVRP